ncbi:MAG: membrane protein insertase YidC, partial [Desulfobacterales bacterium]
MDHVRVIIAIALSFLVFIVWQFLFASKEPVRRAEQSETTPSTSEEKIATEKPYAQQQETVKGAEAQPSIPAQKRGRTITVDTPLYRAEFSEDGAAVKSFVLKKYRERVEKDSPLKQLVSPDLEDGTVLVSFE